MRFIGLGAGVALFGALTGGGATAAGQTPSGDSVAGSTVSPFFINVVFDAHSGPSGEGPRGEVQFNGGGDFTFGGPVTCLNVRGDVATFNIATIFGIVSVEVTDGAATGMSDIIRAPSTAVREPGDCSPFGPLDGPVTDPVTSGNLRIVDAAAAPAPTSADQCENGGHLQFGFRNQGQRVSFVRHGR